jgi:predicted nucleic acid-binding protein
MPDAVSDSSPLIHLAKIEALELISRLYSRILIPPAVWQEVVEESDGRPGALEVRRAVAAGWMLKQAAENKALVIALRQTLDNGEAEAIALATELQNYNQKSRSGLLGRQISPPNGATAWFTSHWYFRSAAAR